VKVTYPRVLSKSFLVFKTSAQGFGIGGNQIPSGGVDDHAVVAGAEPLQACRFEPRLSGRSTARNS
jgi:hypothetical protein